MTERRLRKRIKVGWTWVEELVVSRGVQKGMVGRSSAKDYSSGQLGRVARETFRAKTQQVEEVVFFARWQEV